MAGDAEGDREKKVTRSSLYSGPSTGHAVAPEGTLSPSLESTLARRSIYSGQSTGHAVAPEGTLSPSLESTLARRSIHSGPTGHAVAPKGTLSPSLKSAPIGSSETKVSDPKTLVVSDASQVNLMKSDHFKVICLVGATRVLMHTVLAVLDTGSGPNLVRESLLPKDWRSLAIKQDSYPSIRDANGR